VVASDLTIPAHGGLPVFSIFRTLQQKRQGAVAGTRVASSSTASGLAVQNSANGSGVSRRLPVSVSGRLRGLGMASLGPCAGLI
jgi:hypothetical protein